MGTDWVAEFEKVKPGEERKALYDRYLKSGWWRQQRLAALERAEHLCQLCASDKDLQVHHRIYDRVGCEKPVDLTVLCDSCHKHFHRKPKAKPAKKPRQRQQPKRKKTPKIKVTKGGKTAAFLERLYEKDLAGTYTTTQIATLLSAHKGSTGTFLITAVQRKTPGIERIGKKRWRIAYGKSSWPDHPELLRIKAERAKENPATSEGNGVRL